MFAELGVQKVTHCCMNTKEFSTMSVRRLGVRGRDVCPVCKQSLEAESDSCRVLDPTDAHDARIQCAKEVESASKVPQFRGDAHGTRSDWNPRSATTFCGNKVAGDSRTCLRGLRTSRPY